MTSFNLSALAVRERAVTLFLSSPSPWRAPTRFVKLGRAEDPPFTIKTLTVTAVWPGATAQEMQDLVAEPLEKRMQELRWYDRVETFTRPGLCYMTVTLKDRRRRPTCRRSSTRPARSSAMKRASLPAVHRPVRQRRIFRRQLRPLCAARRRACRRGSWRERPRHSARTSCTFPASRRSTSSASVPSRYSSSFPMPNWRRSAYQRQDDLRRPPAAEHRHTGRLDRHQGPAGVHPRRRRL